MRVSPISPAISNSQSLPALRVGDVLQGRVMRDLGAGRWAVRTRGMEVVVQSGTPLQEGAVIQAEVIGTGTPLRVRLLVGTQGGSEGVQSVDLLAELGIATTAAHQELVQLALRIGLPTHVLESVLAYAQMLPGQPPANVLLAWLMGLPAHALLLEILQSLIEPHTPLGQMLQQLRGSISEYLARYPSEVLAERWQALEQWLPRHPEEGLMRWLQQLGSSFESQLLRGEGLEHLKPLLLEMRALLENQPHPPSREIVRLIDQVLHQLDAHALIHQKPVEFLPLFYFQVPYWLGDRSGTFEFEGRRAGDGEDSLQLTFLVHTVYLGRLKLALQIHQQDVACLLLAETEEARVFVRSHQQELRQRLTALEYRVRQLRCDVGPDEAFVLQLVQWLPSEWSGWSSLDMRV